MDLIKVNTTDLRDAAKDLDTIASEFKDANDNSQKLADAVGHPGLAGHITDFSMNWMQHRADLLKTVDSLKKKLIEGADELEKADQQLAQQLTAPPAASPSGTAPAPSSPSAPAPGSNRGIQ